MQLTQPNATHKTQDNFFGSFERFVCLSLCLDNRRIVDVMYREGIGWGGEKANLFLLLVFLFVFVFVFVFVIVFVFSFVITV